MIFQPWEPDHGYTDKSTLWPAIIVEFSLCIAVGVFFTAARLIARQAVAKFQLEDYLSVAALIVFQGHVATVLIQGFRGFGSHIWNVNPDSIVPIMKMIWATELMYCVETWLAKAALLFQMQRIFSPRNRGPVFVACQCLIWINLAFYFSTFIAACVQCVPTAKIWNINVQGGFCINDGALLIATGVMNMISDIVILFLPFWAIWHLQLPLKLKLWVSWMFAIGLLAVTCSICRFAYTFPAFTNPDHTFYFAVLSLWSIAEVASIILCTCFPLMPRFYQVITGKKHTLNNDLGSDFSSLASRQRSNLTPATTRSQTRANHQSTFRCRDCINDLPCPHHDRPFSLNGSGTTFDDDTRNNQNHTIEKETSHETANSDTTTTTDTTQALVTQNPLVSDHVITVQREFRVQRNVKPERLEESPTTAGRWSGQSNIFSSVATPPGESPFSV